MAKSIYSRRHDRLCELLIEARTDAEFTQQYVADRLGRPQSYIAKVEGGERRLDVIEYIELCETLGVDPEEFISALKSLR